MPRWWNKAHAESQAPTSSDWIRLCRALEDRHNDMSNHDNSDHPWHEAAGDVSRQFESLRERFATTDDKAQRETMLEELRHLTKEWEVLIKREHGSGRS